jgi:hypothetical protein
MNLLRAAILTFVFLAGATASHAGLASVNSLDYAVIEAAYRTALTQSGQAMNLNVR